jgi:hypothetical protein
MSTSDQDNFRERRHTRVLGRRIGFGLMPHATRDLPETDEALDALNAEQMRSLIRALMPWFDDRLYARFVISTCRYGDRLRVERLLGADPRQIFHRPAVGDWQGSQHGCGGRVFWRRRAMPCRDMLSRSSRLPQVRASRARFPARAL